MERKIGEIFEYNGEWYQCIKGLNCFSCFFNGSGNCDKMLCSLDERTDSTSVFFKKLEKWGKTYPNADKLYQLYILPMNIEKLPTHTEGINLVRFDIVEIEIKQNKEDMEEKKKQTSLDLTKDIYEKFKGKTVQCLVNNKDGDLVNGYGIVCGYTNKYLIIGFTNGYEGCIKSFTDNVFLENRDFLSYRFWNISHVDDKPFIKPFNLESARSGKPVCTRDGRKARIICFNMNSFNNHIIVALITEENGTESISSYTSEGKWKETETENDLMMLTEKKEGWVNVYRLNTCYKTKEEAEANIDRDYEDEYVRTVKINWEE